MCATSTVSITVVSNGSQRTRTTRKATTNGTMNGRKRNGNAVCTNPPSDEKGKHGSVILGLLRFLLWNGPLLACWSLFLVTIFVEELWNGPLEQLLRSFELDDVNNYQTPLGTSSALDHELTYYHRRCDHRDISTNDANDLLLDPTMNLEERREVAMTHGAVVMKDILSHETAIELRNYLESRHHEFHTNDLKLSWDELFYNGYGGARLSLGLGPEDTSIVARAISEAGSNPQLKKTLEAIVGEDPAVVEVSTLSTMFDAKPQGIHTDSDFFASSVLYSRSFLHSYTMFISLQDTTSRMGATTICPGTHWCADENLGDLCQCNFLDDDEEEEHPLGYCNTFEASSNGQTGLDVGVLERGDAMMFNQNVWHRGPRNYDEERQENRAMFIMTFLSRRDFEKGDNRQQGWGTYYYMRHSMWGHLLSDLKTAATGGMDLFRKRIWKAYGLIGASKPGNLPWLEHWARMQANNMDFFNNDEVQEFRDMLQELKERNVFARYFFLDDALLKHLFGDEAFDDKDEISWGDYVDLLTKSARHQSKRLYSTVAAVTVLANGLVYAMYCAVLGFLTKQETQKKSSVSVGGLRPFRDVSRGVKSIVVGHLLVLGIAVTLRHYVLYQAPLFKRIHNGDIFWEPFPPLPTGTVYDTVYNEDGEEIGTQSYEQEIHPVELIFNRQDREVRDHELKHPRHPYKYYFDTELYEMEKSRRTASRYFSPKLELTLDEPQIPFQFTAFPERYDVLIGSRFDADFLVSMNFVLDFHPGTKEWIQLMKEHQSSVAENSANEAYLDMVADTIVSKILNDNDGSSLSLLLMEGGMPRRFLKQDYETGWWTFMTEADAKAVTKQALLALVRPLSVGVALDHWKQVLSESRFGKRRHTLLAKKWIPQIVDKRMTELFTMETPSEDPKPKVSSFPSVRRIKGVATRGLGTILLPSTGRGILPKSMVTGKTALSPNSVPLLPPTILPPRVHLRKFCKYLVTLKIGDHIIYNNQDVFFPATVVSIFADSDEVEIQPLRSDQVTEKVSEEFNGVTMFTHIDDIQYYRAAEEGDIVWAMTRDPDDREETSWKQYKISLLTPFGEAEFVMTDEYLQRYSGEDETFAESALLRDVNDFVLIAESVPEIRLRQYA